MSLTQEKLNIYIAGPMRGFPNLNRESFYNAESKLNSDGIWITHNPARWDEDLNLCVEELQSKEEFYKALQRDLNSIFRCDCMFMLRGWERSEGAKLEHALAIALNLTIMYQQ
jgi:hypothetical protein